VLANDLPALFRTRSRYNNQYTIEDTHIFSPNVVNAFQIARNYLKLFDGGTESGYTPVKGATVISQLGLQGIDTTQTQNIAGFPEMSVSGFGDLYTNSGGLGVEEQDWVVQDSISWAIGRHVFKFGGNFTNYNTFHGVVPDFGSFSFDGSFTGNAYADFLLGAPRTSERSNPNFQPAHGFERGWSICSGHVQDHSTLDRRLWFAMGLLRPSIYHEQAKLSLGPHNWQRCRRSFGLDTGKSALP
jgi:hypothetical protein